jgi:hypothetical protein
MKRITRICGIGSIALLAWLAFSVEPANAQYYGYLRTYPRSTYYPPTYSYYPPRPYVSYYGAPYAYPYAYRAGYPGYYSGYYRYPSYYRYDVRPWGGYYYYNPGPRFSFYIRY